MSTTLQSSEIGRLCQREVAVVDAEQSITEAARLMRERHVGCLVVVEPGADPGSRRVVGILTDRDIVVSVVAKEAEPRSLKVGDVMTRNPLLAGEGDPLDAVLTFMGEAGVRRVPVVGPRGALVGVLSLDDVLQKMAHQLASVSGSIRREQRTEYLVRP
jgi:CBS domain-containing protein